MTTEERIAELRERIAGPHVGSIYEEESYFREATEFLLDLLSLSSEDSDETAWLIENRNHPCACGHGLPWHTSGGTLPDGKGRCDFVENCCTTYRPAGAPLWWDGEKFSDAADRAVRFSRRQDAERTIALHPVAMRWAIATEHIWTDAARHLSSTPKG